MDIESPAPATVLYDASSVGLSPHPSMMCVCVWGGGVARPLAAPTTPRVPRQAPNFDDGRRPHKGGRGGGGPTSHGGNPMWSSFYNPWTEIITMWLSPIMGASSPRPHNRLYKLRPPMVSHYLRHPFYHTRCWLCLSSLCRDPCLGPLVPVS
jgi:hypothetical protein